MLTQGELMHCILYDTQIYLMKTYFVCLCAHLSEFMWSMYMRVNRG